MMVSAGTAVNKAGCRSMAVGGCGSAGVACQVLEPLFGV